MRRLHWWIGWILARAYRVYFATLRLKGLLPDGACIAPQDYPFGADMFALCERDLLAVAGVGYRRGVTVLIAPGRDGDLAAALAEHLGVQVVRGLSRHGGVSAMASLVRALEPGRPGLLAVDGPLGPSGSAKPGIIAWAAAAGRPVRPIAAAARYAVVLPGTWSGLYLPVPFSRVMIVSGPLVEASRATDWRSRAAAADLVSRHLRAARERALRAVTDEPEWWRGRGAPSGLSSGRAR